MGAFYVGVGGIEVPEFIFLHFGFFLASAFFPESSIFWGGHFILELAEFVEHSANCFRVGVGLAFVATVEKKAILFMSGVFFFLSGMG